MMRRVPRDDAAASPSRPELRISRAILNPWPTAPRTFSAGTATFSKVTVRVSLPLIPIFCSGWPREIPGDFASTMKAVTRCFVLPSVVTGTLAKTVKTPAYPAFEIQILVPESEYDVPSALGTADDVIACASDPEPGSVRQNAATVSPLAQPGSHLRFCSSVPN